MMRVVVVVAIAVALVGFVVGCTKPPPADKAAGAEKVAEWPGAWSAVLGKSVTLEGKAVDAKSGAMLLGGERSIWIDGLSSWPSGFYKGGRDGKRVRVTGTVIEKKDLPVFVPREGEPIKTGIPVPPGTDLARAATRFLLKDAKWVVLD